MRNKLSVDNDRSRHCGYVINDDGTVIVFLSGGDIVFQFANGKEVVRFADGTNAGWDSNSVFV
ncbi:MAG: hypothetical protein IT342_27445 [Candidatus Melainabacteria bacterium]|nr:hypothetical protein [Candidatus Melainabacteria bacterium]